MGKRFVRSLFIPSKMEELSIGVKERGRAMKYSTLLACGLVIVSLTVHRASEARTKLKLTEVVVDTKSDGPCMSEGDLAESLAAFSSPDSKPESHKEILLGYARRSPRCRAQVVAALL